MVNTPLTYLQLVNRVLLCLRESQVSDLSSNYALQIGEYINEAKEKVEAAWRWKALTSAISFTTVANQTSYQLTSTATPTVTSSSGNFPSGASDILVDEGGNQQVFDTTTVSSGGLIRLYRSSREDEYTKNLYMASQGQVQPNRFSYAHENGVPLFSLVGNPMAGRNIVIRMKIPQATLVNITDTLLVETLSFG